MDFLLGGAAASAACIFTNPLEVVKTRMQLQGELKGRGSYTVHYRNVFHAALTICRTDGVLALQRGLLPGLLYQFWMNGIRLGSYSLLEAAGYTRTAGRASVAKSTVAGAVSGVLGPLLVSPLYMVKTHLQAQSKSTIAVGHQYRHQGMLHALMTIYRQHGITGLWRGSSSAVPRVMVGSAVQLATFSETKQLTRDMQLIPPGSPLEPLVAGMVSSLFTVLAIAPFDVVSTRLYNQPVDQQGKGLFYRSNLDCFAKTVRKEGLSGLYKGTGASYFRLGPHTVLSLFFWDELRKLYWE
ncbi:solute carrier family 25 member 35-like [Amblyraja radiata]|uniref:solute carrier family 25 member 35-like n=1 Tax=Amblyraja radiata TaxID=386614 RepID=UPI0014023635|nr:solute carrier family 25 member 35-like [Amblyraja radiata]